MNINLNGGGIAIIELDEYEALKKLKEQVESGKTARYYDGRSWLWRYCYLTPSEALEQEVEEGNRVRKQLEAELETSKALNLELAKVAGMSLLQFRKWRNLKTGFIFGKP